MKESLKIMGLEPWIYALGFLIQRAIWMLLTVSFVCIFIWLINSGTYSGGEIFILFVALWWYGLGMLTFTMFAQNVFTNPRLITMLLPFLFFVPTGVAMNMILRPALYQEINETI